MEFISKKEIEEIIDELTGAFHSSIKKELDDIEDIEYKITTDSIRIKQEVPDHSILASTVPSEDKSQVEKVVFFTKSICKGVKDIFQKFTF